MHARTAIMILHKILFFCLHGRPSQLKAGRQKQKHDAAVDLRPSSPRPPHTLHQSDRELRLRPRATTMRTLRVPRELDDFRILQPQYLLELLPQTE